MTPTWKQCFDAGMTAPEAARKRGKGCPYHWARYHGLKWPPSPRTAADRPCIINQVHYPSQKVAASALGVVHSTICLALRDGRDQRVGLGRKRRAANG